jgi:hypothetical protein
LYIFGAMAEFLLVSANGSPNLPTTEDRYRGNYIQLVRRSPERSARNPAGSAARTHTGLAPAHPHLIEKIWLCKDSQFGAGGHFL